jgi:hypothetical protein
MYQYNIDISPNKNQLKMYTCEYIHKNIVQVKEDNQFLLIILDILRVVIVGTTCRYMYICLHNWYLSQLKVALYKDLFPPIFHLKTAVTFLILHQN